MLQIDDSRHDTEILNLEFVVLSPSNSRLAIPLEETFKIMSQLGRKAAGNVIHMNVFPFPP